MQKYVGLAALMALSFVGAQADAKRKPEMTPMELQALQSHEYETNKETLFASVVSVFQDLGYQLENADMPSGFITASSATKNRTNVLEAFAGMSSNGFTRATAFVEGMPSGMARVRLNFLLSKSSSGRYGQNSKNDTPILDPQTYKAAWDKIDQAIFMRASTAAPSKSGAVASGTTAPATIVVPVTPGTSVSVPPTATTIAPAAKPK